MELHEATRDQLIKELFKRPGFAGVLVCFRNEILTQHATGDGEVDVVVSKMLSPKGAGYLLAGAAKQFSE